MNEDWNSKRLSNTFKQIRGRNQFFLKEVNVVKQL